MYQYGSFQVPVYSSYSQVLAQHNIDTYIYTYISIFVTLWYDVLCALCLYDYHNKFLQRPINLSYLISA